MVCTYLHSLIIPTYAPTLSDYPTYYALIHLFISPTLTMHLTAISVHAVQFGGGLVGGRARGL